MPAPHTERHAPLLTPKTKERDTNSSSDTKPGRGHPRVPRHTARLSRAPGQLRGDAVGAPAPGRTRRLPAPFVENKSLLPAEKAACPHRRSHHHPGYPLPNHPSDRTKAIPRTPNGLALRPSHGLGSPQAAARPRRTDRAGALGAT